MRLSATTVRDMPSNDENSTFSQANVFVLFLSLSLCLLVQPFGSVLYVRPTSILGRTVFFFWRLNPLACILEVLLLLFALVDGVWAAFQQRHVSPDNPMGFWGHLQVTFAATSLLRSHGRLPDHSKAAGNGSQYFRMTQASQRVASLYNPSPPTAQNDMVNTIVEAMPRHSENELVMLLSPDYSTPNSGGPYLDRESSPNGDIDITGHQPTSPRVRSLPQLEGGGAQDLDFEIARLTSTSRIFSTAPRRSHAEHTISFFSIVAVILIVIKLAAVTIPTHIAVPAWFMVCGWAAVQALLLTSPRRELNSTSAMALIRRAVALEEKLNHQATRAILTILLLPVFGYLTLSVFFRTLPLPEIMKHVPLSFYKIFVVLLIPVVYNVRLNVFPTGCIIRRWKSAKTDECICNQSYVLEHLVLFIVCLVFAATMTWVFGCYMVISFEVCRHESNPPLKYILGPFTVTMALMWIWLFIPGAQISRNGRTSEWIRGVVLFWNISTTILFSIGTMMLYDDDGTQKPGWVEWLGKPRRFLDNY